MFTGLVRGVGTVVASRPKGDLVELHIAEKIIASQIGVGDSVAVSGVCLTATECREDSFSVDVAQETLTRTKLGTVPEGGAVNLELPLKPSERLGGHFVQGHVDGVGRVAFAGPKRGDTVVRVEHEEESSLYVVEKGSIAIDGVSLTVASCGRGWFEVMLIPHTLDATTLSDLSPGDLVNLEYDILAKYMVQIASAYRDLAGG